MRAVIQRVTNAEVSVENSKYSSISEGLLVFLGIGKNDVPREADYLAEKIVNLRLFSNNLGEEMACSLLEKDNFELLVVSQFTLFGDCRKGRKPSFSNAASAVRASELYDYFLESLIRLGANVKTGKFQSNMVVTLSNQGPFTLLLDSKREF